MPLYYFTIEDDDAEGTELRDDGAARLAARETFGTMIKEGIVGPSGSMKVRDAAGRQIATLTFLEKTGSD